MVDGSCCIQVRSSLPASGLKVPSESFASPCGPLAYFSVTVSSVRRFWARPGSVWFDAMGCSRPKP